jgi:hypothetical protein
LKNTPHANRLDFNAFARVAQTLAGIGRILLMLTAFSLITMPVTQHLWTWDNFLHGGQDFELGTLLLLSLLSLVLVLTKHSKQCIDSLFAAWCLLATNLNDCALLRIPALSQFMLFPKNRIASPALDARTLPLKI